MAEITGMLRAYRAQEEQLLNGLRSSGSQVNPLTTEVTKGVMGELGATVAEELFGMRSMGRKVGRALASQGDRQSLRNLRQNIENQHNATVSSIISLLSGVSEGTAGRSRQNSSKLTRRISRAQGFTRIETRILKTIAELQTLETADLVSNQDTVKPEHDESSRLIERIPRISAIRAVLPEIEPEIRKFIRTSLANSEGPNWQTNLRAKFPKDFVRWTERAKSKGSADPLDGQTFGEMIQTVRSFPELNKLVSTKPEFHLALNILNSARPLFIHPLNTQEKDIKEEEFTKIMLAMKAAIDSLSGSSHSN